MYPLCNVLYNTYNELSSLFLANQFCAYVLVGVTKREGNNTSRRHHAPLHARQLHPPRPPRHFRLARLARHRRRHLRPTKRLGFSGWPENWKRSKNATSKRTTAVWRRFNRFGVANPEIVGQEALRLVLQNLAEFNSGFCKPKGRPKILEGVAQDDAAHA